MLVVRFLFGAGEAGAFPGMAQAAFKWIPMEERGTVQGINFSGSRLGAAFALPAIALMIDQLGWRMSLLDRFRLVLESLRSLFDCEVLLWSSEPSVFRC